ncbi:dehydrogenase [Amylostereum chailletii]|nr:dehydrogenase [Amylostereum chailletii]
MAPSQQKAVLVQSDGFVTLGETAVPSIGSGQVLVKIVAAAQNPADWKTALFAKRAGSVSGCDFAGIVEEIGPDALNSDRTVGERVAGFVHGGLYSNGTFAEYVVADASFVVRVPDSWTFEEAAQLGIAPFTALQTLYSSLKGLPTPLSPNTVSPPPSILISGGASSVGQYLVQFAKLSGMQVLATASGRNAELVKALGADIVFDYGQSDVASQIKDATEGKLMHAVDAISEVNTVKLVADALADEGAVAAIIIPQDSPRESVRFIHSLSYKLLGVDFDFPAKNVGTPEQKAEGLRFAKLLTDILALGEVRPNPVKILPKGLASVPEGFELHRTGKVSGQKITYRIADTPES